MNQKLSFVPTLFDAFGVATKNFVSIVIAVALWLVTIWIPYINVGTTIAICNLPVELSKDGIINPLSIFDSKYRHQMGEFILLESIIFLCIFVSMIFLFVPAIVISFSWSQAILLLLDKQMNWAQCLTESNRMTMGYKFKMFLLYGAMGSVVWLIFTIASTIFSGMSSFMFILFLLICILAMSFRVSLDAVVYRELSKTDDEEENSFVAA